MNQILLWTIVDCLLFSCCFGYENAFGIVHLFVNKELATTTTLITNQLIVPLSTKKKNENKTEQNYKQTNQINVGKTVFNSIFSNISEKLTILTFWEQTWYLLNIELWLLVTQLLLEETDHWQNTTVKTNTVMQSKIDNKKLTQTASIITKATQSVTYSFTYKFDPVTLTFDLENQ